MGKIEVPHVACFHWSKNKASEDDPRRTEGDGCKAPEDDPRRTEGVG